MHFVKNKGQITERFILGLDGIFELARQKEKTSHSVRIYSHASVSPDTVTLH